jgi:transcriptional antiterminator RfaH
MGMLNNNWFLVMTKPRMEQEAYEHLARQGFELYLPYWTDVVKQRGNWKPIRLLMFPRYLFVRPSTPDQSLAPIRSTRGVSQLVRFGTEPAKASEMLIHEIRQLERSRNDGSESLVPFKKGDLVEVVQGAFQGVSAEVFSCDQQRVILLLQVLGKTQNLEFKASACVAI